VSDSAVTTRPQLAEPRSQTTSPLNPFTMGEVTANAHHGGGLIAVEQQRAIAEVQARMIIARANPRDPIRAMERILNDCTRPSLADNAVYQYARGGTDIRGPSIRLAEAIAQRWGNLASGIKELSRRGGYSECVAYAWDLESGYYDERQFQIRHWRDTRQGGYELTDERDIYELIANFGQRRKRAVLLTVIPGDVTEAALQQCERTMQAGADVSPEGIKKLIETFGSLGVTAAQLEAYIQRRVDAIRPAQVVTLRKIYASIHDGMSSPADWFGAGATESGQAAGDDPQAGAATPRRRGRPPGPRQQQQQPSSEGEKIIAGQPEQPTTAAEQEQQEPTAGTQRRVNFEI
jgi:hypothetical protein